MHFAALSETCGYRTVTSAPLREERRQLTPRRDIEPILRHAVRLRPYRLQRYPVLLPSANGGSPVSLAVNTCLRCPLIVARFANE